jgi:hypothetical protein
LMRFFCGLLPGQVVGYSFLDGQCLIYSLVLLEFDASGFTGYLFWAE